MEFTEVTQRQVFPGRKIYKLASLIYTLLTLAFIGAILSSFVSLFFVSPETREEAKLILYFGLMTVFPAIFLITLTFFSNALAFFSLKRSHLRFAGVLNKIQVVFFLLAPAGLFAFSELFGRQSEIEANRNYLINFFIPFCVLMVLPALVGLVISGKIRKSAGLFPKE